MSVGEEDAMALDADLIKVLAADSRRDILRHLGKRRMTLSELATLMGLQKATVLEHLKKLVEADLIRRKDDERLWVYYELTKRGGRVVNPGRTRFILVFSLSALAIAVAGLVVAFTFFTADDAPGFPAAPLAVAINDATFGQGVPLLMDAHIPPGSDPGLRFHLLSQAEWATREEAQFASLTGPSLAVFASGATQDGGTTLTVQADAQPPGSYRLVVIDRAGRTNAATAPTITIEPLVASVATGIAWRGISESASLEVLRSGAPVDGALVIGPRNAPILTLAVTGGSASLDAPTLDGLPVGTYALAFGEIPLAGTLTVRDPYIALDPPQVVVGQAANVTVSLTGPTNASADIRRDGTTIGTVSNGTGRVSVAPSAVGLSKIHVGRLALLPLPVVESFTLFVSHVENGHLIRVLDARDMPVTGAIVSLGATALGTTDADGRLALGELPTGLHTLGVATENAVHEVPITVEAGVVRERAARISVLQSTAGDRLAVAITNEGRTTERVVFRASFDGVPVYSQAFDAAPGVSRLEFDAPAGVTIIGDATVVRGVKLAGASATPLTPSPVTSNLFHIADTVPTTTTTPPTVPLGGSRAEAAAVPGAGVVFALVAVVAAAALVQSRVRRR